MSQTAKKEEEAAALMKSAKKHHTKSFTKWSADWDAAATDYEKAAQIYTNTENVEAAREAWSSASNAHKEAGNLFFAAKALETLASFLKDHKGTDAEMAELHQRAAKHYALDNKPDRQAEALTKAAKLAPAEQAGEAAKVFISALDALEENGKYHLTLDLYRSLLLMQVRGKLIPDAIVTLKREMKAFQQLEQPQSAAKAGLEIVVLALFMGDVVLADREFNRMTADIAFGFVHSKEQAAAYDLISAIQDRDEERLNAVAKEQLFHFLTNDIARMVKTLKIEGGPAAKSKKDESDSEDGDNIR